MAAHTRIVISNFSPPIPAEQDFRLLWSQATPPPTEPRLALFEQKVDWGFHLFSIGVHLMDLGLADRVEFWDYRPERRMSYLENGLLKVTFLNENDVAAYLDRFGPPDLFINHGRNGVPVLRLLEGKTFRVHVPALRFPRDDPISDAECFLVDSEEQLIDRAMLYVPVVHTAKIRPGRTPAVRDFIYLASCYSGKRHDLLVDAVRGTEITGHLHPVGASQLDLSNTLITTSEYEEHDVVDLLQTSRIAVYPGDQTSNPAAMWECVAAGLPIVVNEAILGGKHLVVPGVTGELAAEKDFLEVMRYVLDRRSRYRPRDYFEATWDTVGMIEGYIAFFREMGWNA
jgi:hypothetical protein